MKPAGDAEQRDFGVALSGGGVRASAFALGALLALVDSGLNRKVGVISSVSGASLTNGFVLTRASDFSALDTGQFDAIARELLRRLTTTPLMGVGTLLVYALLVGAGVVSLIVAVFAWPFDAPPLVRFALPFIWGAVFLLRGRPIELAIARRYLAAAPVPFRFAWPVGGAMAVFLAYVVLLAEPGAWPPRWSWTTWLWALVAAEPVVLAVQISFARRSASALGPHLGRSRAAHATTHVFCATDLVTESPLFLVDHGGRGWAFGRYGWAEASRVPLATAVRASAALPGAFPPRALPTAWLTPASTRFSDPELPRWLHLSDGGVWDNLGTQWFGDEGAALSDWGDVTTRFGDAPQTAPHGAAGVRRLLVVDGRGWGTGFTHGRARFRSTLLKTPLLGELASLSGASSIQYENTVEPRTQAYTKLLSVQLDGLAADTLAAGVATLTKHPLQTVETEVFRLVAGQLLDHNGKPPDRLDPSRVAGLAARYQALAAFHGALGSVLDALEAAQPAWLAAGAADQRIRDLHLRCAQIGTKLTGLSEADAMALVIHGYVQAMAAAAALVAVEDGHAAARCVSFPGLERFERLLPR